MSILDAEMGKMKAMLKDSGTLLAQYGALEDEKKEEKKDDEGVAPAASAAAAVVSPRKPFIADPRDRFVFVMLTFYKLASERFSRLEKKYNDMKAEADNLAYVLLASAFVLAYGSLVSVCFLRLFPSSSASLLIYLQFSHFPAYLSPFPSSPSLSPLSLSFPFFLSIRKPTSKQEERNQ